MASVRQKSDERWREMITSLVLAGQEAGEFAAVDAADFSVCLSALLDGLAIQIALEDRVVDPVGGMRAKYAFCREPAGVQVGPGPGEARR